MLEIVRECCEGGTYAKNSGSTIEDTTTITGLHSTPTTILERF